jgi:hypothetical protein
LGIQREPHGQGAAMHWREDQNPERRGMTVWALFEKRSQYFEPSRAPKVSTSIPQREHYDYGRFARIMDPEVNKFELGEPPKE